MSIVIENGDCLELMKNLPDKSIDLFICDLPYGETNCAWDSKIDLNEFWKQFKRLRKSKRTACIHFCSTKFGYTLIKSWEKGFKMDMVWKKRNRTGGLQSRYRPMRNHEMVYFFYEQSPKYNRDKYHKRIQEKLPIIKDDKQIMGKGYAEGQQPPFNSSKYFDPPNPASVVEESDANNATIYKDRKKGNKDGFGMDEEFKNLPYGNQFDPKLPASVVEETDVYGEIKSKRGERVNGIQFDPPNPASVVEEPEPVSMFESTKVFIGKRHHQTEKPLDILEFFLKYWTDEKDTVLDPTMGSGSTGVACKKLNRNFIGFELDPIIFGVAEKRLETE